MEHRELCRDQFDFCAVDDELGNSQHAPSRAAQRALFRKVLTLHEGGEDVDAEIALGELYAAARSARTICSNVAREVRSTSVRFCTFAYRKSFYQGWVIKRFDTPGMANLECALIRKCDTMYPVHAIGRYVLHRDVDSPDAYQVLSWLPADDDHARRISYTIAASLLFTARHFHGSHFTVPEELRQQPKYREKLHELFGELGHAPQLRGKLEAMAEILEAAAVVPFRDANLWNARVDIEGMLWALDEEGWEVPKYYDAYNYPKRPKQLLLELLGATHRGIPLEEVLAHIPEHVTQYDFSTLVRKTFFADDAIHIIDASVFRSDARVREQLWEFYCAPRPGIVPGALLHRVGWMNLQVAYRNMRTAYHCGRGELPHGYVRYRRYHENLAYRALHRQAGQQPTNLRPGEPALPQLAAKVLELNL